MKLKHILLVILLSGLCACPCSDDDTYFSIFSFNINNVNTESGETIKDNGTISWSQFAIQINFETQEILTQALRKIGNSAYAKPYSFPIAKPQITEILITHSVDLNSNEDITNQILIYRYNEKCSDDKIWCLNNMAALDFENTNNSLKHYLKFNKPPSHDLKGKFYLVLKFEDGTVLKDSTQTITIKINE